MCGIVGFVDFDGLTEEHTLSKMTKTIHHRGPDDSGNEIWKEGKAKIGFGHARLSIIDLSEAGHQPMHFADISIVYNGEIYNFSEIKIELEKLGHKFISHSDTEVILHAYQEWGLDCVERFIGMFAFAIYDKNKKELILIRDRAGVKPLHYYHKDNLFIFASELKSIHAHNRFQKEINEDAISLFFSFGYIPAPYTIYKNTWKLESGKILKLDLNNKETNISKYWDVRDYYKQEKLKISYQDAKTKLHEILKSAFNYRMVADVPVGVFLSGGYDSTAVTAILQKDRTEKLKTFTIGFEEGNNEAPYAKQTAEYLGTDHTEYICTTKEAQDIIPELPYYYDEPFGDSSAIPTTLVSRIARKHVTVALSADAGDEIFAGYETHLKLLKFQNQLRNLPSWSHFGAKPLLQLVDKALPITNVALKHKLYSVRKSIQQNSFQQAADLFSNMASLPMSMHSKIFNKDIIVESNPFFFNAQGFHEVIDSVLAQDYRMYLQNNILTKVDRATMSVSLEGREPILDHRIVEFAARLPFEYKFDGKVSKKILKDIVHDYLPEKMMNRPKTGFSLPISLWLREELSYLIDEYLNPESIKLSGLFNEVYINNQVKLFRENKVYYTPFIWYLLMFQMWYKKWML